MGDIATPNLPSRSFNATEAFYAKLGFERGWRDNGWTSLKRGPKGNAAILEFFPHPQLKPAESWFSCCIRLDDLAAFVDTVEAAKVPMTQTGIPRLHEPAREASGLEIAYLTDPDGTLIRLIQHD